MSDSAKIIAVWIAVLLGSWLVFGAIVYGLFLIGQFAWPWLSYDVLLVAVGVLWIAAMWWEGRQ